MKFVRFVYITLLLVGVFCMGGCKSTSTESFYTYETECLGVELDGSQMLKVWGTGKNKEDAISQAMKNAVRDVLFKGIHSGKQDCGLRPLLLEVNVQEKNEDYFNTFFADGGAYAQYVWEDSPKSLFNSKEKEYNKSGTKIAVIVKVDRAALKKRMEQDGIIKK